MCVLHILTMIVLIKFDYIIYDKSNAILTYGVDDFLKFLNETIFTGCKEKAYIESRNGKKYNKVNYCIDLK